MKKIYCFICGKYRKFRNLKMSYIFGIKRQFFLLFAVSAKMKVKKSLKKKNRSVEILKILGLFKDI